MLKRIQNYAKTKPLQMWLLSAAFLLTFNVTGYLLIPGARNPGLLMLVVCISVSPPTSALIRRLSDEQRRVHPVARNQEAWIGVLSLCAAAGSIGSYAVAMVGKHFGLAFPVTAYLLMLYSMLALMALALGYASRNTPAGRGGLKIAVGWIALLIIVAFVLTVIRLRQ